MREAYLDTSFAVSIALLDPGWEDLAATADGFAMLHASELLAAEFLATLKRRAIDPGPVEQRFETISWIIPTRSIRPEIDRVLAHGALRGADLWHLACALYLSPQPKALPFLTRDDEQRAVAKRIGFPLP